MMLDVGLLARGFKQTGLVNTIEGSEMNFYHMDDEIRIRKGYSLWSKCLGGCSFSRPTEYPRESAPLFAGSCGPRLQATCFPAMAQICACKLILRNHYKHHQVAVRLCKMSVISRHSNERGEFCIV